MLGDESYIFYADFASVLGLQVSDPVTIAGVRVGEVDSISLKDYQARVSMRIGHDVQVRQDAVASTESLGFALMGDKRVSIDPGTSAKPLRPGDEIAKTHSPRTFQDLVGQWFAGDLVPDA